MVKKISELLLGAKLAYQKKGAFFMLRSGIKILFWYPYYKKTRSPKTFAFQGKSYHYFTHYYNLTWENERAVEVPIIGDIMERARGKRILEVGNVLANYFPAHHDILDKYEKVPGVINEDVCDFKPPHPYDLIVSLSTLEHVGWDEEPREPLKILKAFENLKHMVAPHGKIVVTLPIGYNPALDDLLRNEKIAFTSMHCLKRISRDNRWKEMGWNDIKYAQYHHPFPGINGIIIGTIAHR